MHRLRTSVAPGERAQAVATVNRCLVTLRRFFGWLVEQGHIPANPARAVKELRRQMLAPKGLDRGQVRRLLREVELRQDIRVAAIFHLLLYTGCRVSELVNLELSDLMLGERSGTVVVVRRKADGMKGSLEFQHDPRLYFSFQPDRES